MDRPLKIPHRFSAETFHGIFNRTFIDKRRTHSQRLGKYRTAMQKFEFFGSQDFFCLIG